MLVWEFWGKFGSEMAKISKEKVGVLCRGYTAI